MNVLDKRIYNFFAFISYNRNDKKWAELVQRKLDHFKIPPTIKATYGDVPESLSPIFRDVTNLNGGVLTDEIKNAIVSSEYMIIICSPNSASSEWVNKEVEEFISLGRTEYIIPFIVDGEPRANDPTKECFPENLRKLSGNQELLGINVNDLGREAALVKVISRMLRVPFDDLWHRVERSQKLMRRFAISSMSILVLLMMAVVGYIYTLNRTLKINHSRYVAENTEQMISEIGLMSALKLLLEVAPTNSPYSFEVEKAVRNVYHRIQYDSYAPLFSVKYNSMLAYEILGGNKVAVINQNMIEVRDIDTFIIKDSVNILHIGSVPIICSKELSESVHYLSFSTSLDEIYLGIINNDDIAPLKKLGVHEGVKRMCFMHNTDYLITISSNRIIIWDVEIGRVVSEITYDDRNVNVSSLSDSDLLAVSFDNNLVSVYDLMCNKPNIINEGKTKNFRITSMVFKPGTETLCLSTKEKSILIYEDVRHNIESTVVFQNSVNSIDHIMFSPKGDFMLAVSDRFIRVWDTSDMMEMQYSPIDNEGSITTLCIDKESKALLTGSFDGNIRVWNIVDGNCIIVHPYKGWIKSIDFSGDNDYILSMSSEMTLNCWNGPNKTGNMWMDVDSLTNPKEYELSKCDTLSPDGKYSMRIANDKIYIRELRNDRVVAVCDGHRGKVNCASFSPNSKLLVSGGVDKTVRVWDIKNGKELYPTIKGHERSIVDVRFNDDQTEILSVSMDRTRRSWPIKNYYTLLDECMSLTENINLSEEDLKKYYIK